MPDKYSTDILELQEYEDFLTIAFSNGFSKGTKNVSPADMKKLAPLLKHYSSQAHPFRACVKDNKKRFGPLTEKYCAVIKDLIFHSTKWRGKGNTMKPPTNLSEEELSELHLHWEDYPDNYIDEFLESLAELTEKDVILLLQDNNNDIIKDEMTTTEVDLAAGEIAWSNDGSWNDIRAKIETALNDGINYDGGLSYWVSDVKNSEALVCERGKDYYVVPFSVDKKSGDVDLGDEIDWKLVQKEWIELNMSENPDEFMAELFFTEPGGSTDNDGLVWKTFLREGVWEYSPGNGGKVPRTLTITKTGKSDQKKLIISMSELKKNFDAGAIQHITVPLSHEDKVTENTGFVKKLRYGKDDKGRTTLEAAIDFTEPDIKGKIDRGTIPNVSGGIHFNYIDKERGKKFNAVLGHLALTPKPWLQGMTPFGVKASENLNVVSFSEAPQTSEPEIEGGTDNMTTVEHEETANTFLQELNLSEDEVKARLARYDELEVEAKQNRIDQKVREWEKEKKTPALVTAAKAILMADEGTVVLNLSEEGKEVSLTASDIVDRLVAAAPNVALADDPITDEAAEGTAPPEDATEENLSDEVKAEARHLFLRERFSEEDAIAEAIRRNKETTA